MLRVPKSEYKNRVDRLRSLMMKENLDALLVYWNFTEYRPGRIAWLTNIKPVGPHSLVIVPKQDEPVLLTSLSWGRDPEGETWINEIRASTNLPKDCRTILDQIHAKKVGLVGAGYDGDFPYDFYTALEKELQGLEVVWSNDLFEMAAHTLNKDEIPLVRKVCEINDAIWETVLTRARVGMLESDLHAEMDYTAFSMGSEDVFMMFSSGKRSLDLHMPRLGKRIEAGDIVIGEITPYYKGYALQITRTGYIGTAPDLLKEKYAVLAKCVNASLEVCRPGHLASEIAEMQNKVFIESGYDAKYSKHPYMSKRGHGYMLGSVGQMGQIDETTKVRLEAGMAIVTHMNQYVPEAGYLACGEPLLITEDRPEVMTKLPLKVFDIHC